MDAYGYRHGPRVIVPLPVDSSTSDITAGDILAWGTAGYVQQAAAGGAVIAGVAVESVASPSSDGDVTILVDVSPLSVYAYPPDSGSVTAGLAGTTMDIGGVRSIDIDASVDDVVRVVQADVTNGVVFVSFKTAETWPGVA